MKQPPLTVPRLAAYNLRRRPFRTACLIAVVSLLSFAVFGGSILTASLRNGMRSMEQRLGADIMVVPNGNEADLEGMLLKGKPSYYYFDRSYEQRIAQVEGVAQTTSQFFLTSLNAECCSLPLQLIGFDPTTDFAVQPWIAKVYSGTLEDGQLIAGSEVVLDGNHTLKFFDQTFPVAAKLEETASGLDASIFMNMNTMKIMIANALKNKFNFYSIKESEYAVSSVLVKVAKDYDAQKVARDIRFLLPDTDVIESHNMIQVISDSLGDIAGLVRILSAVILILSAIVLTVVFAVAANERKKEFAVIRILGATRRKLTGIVLAESFAISVAGGLIGVAAAAVTVFSFSVSIGDRLDLPYLTPGLPATLGILAVSLLLSFAAGPLAAIYSAVKISNAETYLTMREGE